MSGLGGGALYSAGIELTTAALFAIWGATGWRILRGQFPHARTLRVLPHPGLLIALHYFATGIQFLLPASFREAPPLWVLLTRTTGDVSLALALALFAHLSEVVLNPDERLGGRTVALAYAVALVVSATVATMQLALPPAAKPLISAVLGSYLIVWTAIMVRKFSRYARPGPWGSDWISLRRRDLAIYCVAVLLLAAGVMLALRSGRGRPDLFGPTLHVTIGLLFLVPAAVRMLDAMVRQVVVGGVVLAAIGTVYLGARAVTEHAGVAYQPVVDASALVLLLAIAVVGTPRVRAAVDRVVFGRRSRRGVELEVALQAISPDVGAAECCRRALAAVSEAMHLRAAAVLFDDGQAVTYGRFEIARLLAVWPRGPASSRLPARLSPITLRTLPSPLRETLAEAGVFAAVAIASPRRHWGHLLVTTTMLGSIATYDDLDALAQAAGELGILLDAADLLERTVAVERSLAHAEKLAAIGELAARFAHDIRNPVTAARSLAQQLARDPAAPENAEHAGIILEELERVERQVRDLLRFARRDDLRPEPLDLGALVRAVTKDLGARIDAVGVSLDLDTSAGVVARADPEKMRQVVVNLLENAVDALAASPGPRRLRVAVTRANGAAHLTVDDSGPGVAPELLPRLFEPFFSLKPTGTGLGLAIVKRTVEAHGGTITATSRPGEGTTFALALPTEAP